MVKPTCFFSLALLAACAPPPSAPPPSAPPPAAAAAPAALAEAAAPAAPAAPAVKRVARAKLVSDPKLVCMVNDQFMGRDQIPVVVEGRTYFGCCEMCKGRLATDAKFRTAKDPITGREVDKASAVIAQRPSGQVLYFESLETFQTYVD